MARDPAASFHSRGATQMVMWAEFDPKLIREIQAHDAYWTEWREERRSLAIRRCREVLTNAKLR